MQKLLLSLSIILVAAVPTLVSANHPDGGEEHLPDAVEVCQFHGDLFEGLQSEEVKCLQLELNEELDDDIPVTGFFGPLTKAGLIKWQQMKGLPATGFFGPLSRERIGKHDAMMITPVNLSGKTPEELEVMVRELKHRLEDLQKEAKGNEAAHAHSRLQDVDAANAPTVAIHLHRDPHSGWNLELVTTHFRFAPEHVGQAHVAGEGHAHVYVDGVKIGRIYGNWHYLPTQKHGTHTLKVTLSTNDHAEYAVDGKVVHAETSFVEE